MPAPDILIPTGTSIDAERTDRPLAYRLRERILRELDGRGRAAEPVVVSDAWFLDRGDPAAIPAIAVGPPTRNAAAAWLEDRIPVALSVRDALTVRIDLDFVVPLASCWGVSDAATASACDALVERYLPLLVDRWLGPG